MKILVDITCNESSFIQAIIEHIPVIPNVPPKPVWQFDDTRAIVFKKNEIRIHRKFSGTGNWISEIIILLKITFYVVFSRDGDQLDDSGIHGTLSLTVKIYIFKYY